MKTINRIESMINELCPDGVEYLNLEDCCNILDKKRKPVTKSLRESGIYAYYGANGIQDYVSDYIFDGTFILVGEDGSVITKSGTPVVTWAKGKIWVNNHAHIIEENGNVLLRYLFHFIQTIDITSLVHGNIPKLTGKDFKALKIPVPPIEVQREIVRILDSFTELTELSGRETELRQKQYEYYRDYLLDFNDNVEYKPLGDIIISLKMGLNPRQNFSLNKNGSIFPYITGKDIYDNAINITERTDKITLEALSLINKRAGLEKGLLLFASTGTGTVGRMAIIQSYDNNWGISETLYAIKVNEQIILTNFLMYYLYSSTAKNQFVHKISKGSVPHLKVKDLKDVKVPILPIEEQIRIVNILDVFFELMKLSKRETELRQKQYEYYRDKILTF